MHTEVRFLISSLKSRGTELLAVRMNGVYVGGCYAASSEDEWSVCMLVGVMLIMCT